MRYMWLFSLDTAGKVFVERKYIEIVIAINLKLCIYTAKTKVHY